MSVTVILFFNEWMNEWMNESINQLINQSIFIDKVSSIAFQFKVMNKYTISSGVNVIYMLV